jgi:hypothetical protein
MFDVCMFTRLITEHVYTAGMSELVKEDCAALAFILGEPRGLQRDVVYPG